MRYRLNKLAIALRHMGQEEEAEELEGMIHSYYGDWLQELPQIASELFMVNFGEAKRTIEEKFKNFNWAGSGAFRYVIGINGDDSFVVKIARGYRGSMMNESESNKQLEFGGLFPKVHHHGSGTAEKDRPYKGSEYDWVVMDKVLPIKSSEELIQFFPELSKELEEQNILANSVLGRLLHWSSHNEGGKERMDFAFINPLKAYVHTGEAGIIKLMESAKKDPMFRRLSMLSAKLNIDAKDLGIGNLGTNHKGELMVLDASLAKDFESSPHIAY
jgi:hypothetical protein